MHTMDISERGARPMKKSRLLWKQVLLYSLIFFVFILGLIYLAYANLADISTGYLLMSQFSKTGTIMLHTDQYLDPMLRIATQVSHDTEVIRLMQELDADTSGSRANHFLTEKDDRETLSGILAGHLQLAQHEVDAVVARLCALAQRVCERVLAHACYGAASGHIV